MPCTWLPPAATAANRKRCRPTERFALPALLLAAAAVCLLPGCGSDGPQRYEVSGTVTYAGKPVPAGTIQFIPDTKRQNRGPAGVAKIENGAFDTGSGGKGCVPGPHMVLIRGSDGHAQEEMEGGRPLFSEYRTTVDLPEENGPPLKFDIPATHR